MIGLMWADSQNTLQNRVREAADAYHHKHGRWPTLCQVRSGGGMGIECQPGVVVRVVEGPMPRHHLLIGENGANDVSEA